MDIDELIDNAKECYLCGKPFGDEFYGNADDKVEYYKSKNGKFHKKKPKRLALYTKKNRQKVLDHNNLIEKENLLGVAHSICNLQRQSRHLFMPIIFHNGSNYDFHLMLREFCHFLNSPVGKGYRMGFIAKTAHQFLSMSFGKDGKFFKFIDSRKFMPESEEALGNQLANREDDYEMSRAIIENNFKDIFPSNVVSCIFSMTTNETFEKFKQTREYFENNVNERFRNGNWKLLTRKGALPYEYYTPERLKETELPPIEKFISSITGKSITRRKYEELKEIWTSFGCKTLGDFLDVYLESDVMMLSDIFENFRENCLRSYHLDPCNLISTPSLAYQALLLKSGVSIEPIQGLDKLNFILRAKHGGLSQVYHKICLC